MSFEVLNSQKLFSGKMLELWLERVLYPDGRQVEREIIKHPGSVGILPIDSDGQIWFSYQYRHPVGGMLLELPAGTLEAGEKPQKCAEREIREEIGMGANHIEEIGAFYIAPGYSDEVMTIYLAKDLYPEPLAQDFGEFIEVKKLNFEDVYELLDKGDIKDAKTAAILGVARGKIF